MVLWTIYGPISKSRCSYSGCCGCEDAAEVTHNPLQALCHGIIYDLGPRVGHRGEFFWSFLFACVAVVVCAVYKRSPGHLHKVLLFSLVFGEGSSSLLELLMRARTLQGGRERGLVKGPGLAAMG